MIERADRLVRDLRREWPDARVELRPSPSGSYYLDVFRGDRWLQMMYSSAHRVYCVDETRDEDAFRDNYRFASDDFDAAAAELRRIVGQAVASANGDNSHAPRAAQTAG